MNNITSIPETPSGLCTPYINQSVMADVSEEFSLPDYYPEIKRIASVESYVLPENRFDNGDEIEENGIVSYTVLYLGDDDTLCALPLTSDYAATVVLPRGERGESTIGLDSFVEGITYRATGPRKITLKARIRVSACGDKRISCDYDIHDIGGGDVNTAEKISVQVKNSTVSTMIHSSGKLTGTASGEFSDIGSVKPIMCGGDVIIHSVSPSESGAFVKGAVCVRCLCEAEDGTYKKITASVPIEETVSLDGSNLDNGKARCCGRCSGVTVRESDGGGVYFDAEYDLECECASNIDVSVASDMFSTMWESTTQTKDCDSLALLVCENGRLTLEQSARRTTEKNDGEYVIYSFGNAKAERAECSGGKFSLFGTAEVKTVICGGGDVSEESIKIPFRYECDVQEKCGTDIIWRACVTVGNIHATLDGDTVKVSCEIYVSVLGATRIQNRIVTALELDRSQSVEGDGAVHIYYHSPDDEKWDISKKFRVPPESIGGDEGFTVICK